MRKPILVVASQFAKDIEDRIDRSYDPRRNPNTVPFSRDQLLAAADGADAIFVTPLDRLDSIFFQRVSPTVRVIATYSVGFEHIDLQEAAKRKIAVAYTPGINSDATADIAMLLLLGASRRSYEAQDLVRTGTWRPLSPNMLLGWRVGGSGVGSDVMKPIAAPIVGGMITSTIHVLILVPVFFALMKERALRRGTPHLQGNDSANDGELGSSIFELSAASNLVSI